MAIGVIQPFSSWKGSGPGRTDRAGYERYLTNMQASTAERQKFLGTASGGGGGGSTVLTGRQPAQRQTATIRYKPHSEADGRLVVLHNQGGAVELVDRSGNVIEQGRSFGPSNGYGDTVRFGTGGDSLRNVGGVRIGGVTYAVDDPTRDYFSLSTAPQSGGGSGGGASGSGLKPPAPGAATPKTDARLRNPYTQERLYGRAQNTQFDNPSRIPEDKQYDAAWIQNYMIQNNLPAVRTGGNYYVNDFYDPNKGNAQPAPAAPTPTISAPAISQPAPAPTRTSPTLQNALDMLDTINELANMGDTIDRDGYGIEDTVKADRTETVKEQAKSTFLTNEGTEEAEEERAVVDPASGAVFSSPSAARRAGITNWVYRDIYSGGRIAA